MFFNEDAGLASGNASEFYKKIAAFAIQKKFLSLVGLHKPTCTGFEPNYRLSKCALAFGAVQLDKPAYIGPKYDWQSKDVIA